MRNFFRRMVGVASPVFYRIAEITELFLRWIDEIAALKTENRFGLWLERTAFIFLILMTLSAPHSIAATQIAWLLGMLAWTIRIFFKPRPRFKIGALDYALWAFFAWSVVSSAVSYAPDISLDKLRGVSLFLIFYFVYNNLHTRRAARFVAGALIFSSMVAVLWMPIERIIGRGVQIYDFRGSAFDQIGLREGDIILQIDGKKVNSLAEAKERIFENPEEPRFKALIQHADLSSTVEVSRELIKAAATPEESLGIRRWNKSHSWRAAGFYGHFTTFAEVLQLIFSLAFGIFIAVIAKHRFFTKTEAAEPDENRKPKTENRLFGFSLFSILLFCLAAMSLALLLTATRASQLAFLVSAFCIVLIGGNRKMILMLAAIVLPLGIAGSIYLQQLRRVDFFDAQDSSTNYRQTVYREGFQLWTSSARNFTFGVGMDSIKRYAPEWRLFDNGRLPMGHFHSTPLQLLVERGLPALLIWLTILGIYARTLWRHLKLRITNYKSDSGKSQIPNPESQIETGIVLGCLGGAIGFFTGGLVHYNLGDGEVAMVFYLLMGLSVFICDSRFEIQDSATELNLESRI